MYVEEDTLVDHNDKVPLLSVFHVDTYYSKVVPLPMPSRAT